MWSWCMIARCGWFFFLCVVGAWSETFRGGFKIVAIAMSARMSWCWTPSSLFVKMHTKRLCVHWNADPCQSCANDLWPRWFGIHEHNEETTKRWAGWIVFLSGLFEWRGGWYCDACSRLTDRKMAWIINAIGNRLAFCSLICCLPESHYIRPLSWWPCPYREKN